jgi:protein-tyrosine-phosphatase
MTIVFLCTGNINRSAAASVIANAYGFADVISAGTSVKAREAKRMAKRTREPLLNARIDPELVMNHRSQYIGDVDLTNVKAIIGFQPSHRQWCKEAGYAHIYHDVTDLAYHNEWSKRNKVPDPGFNAPMAAPVVRYLLTSLKRIMQGVSCTS